MLRRSRSNFVVKTTSESDRKNVLSLWKEFKKLNKHHERPFISYNFKEYKTPQLALEDRFSSKLGGHPFWPADQKKFPYLRSLSSSTKKKHDPSLLMGDLCLLLQFNLSDITLAQRKQLHLPQDGGILQFYVAPDVCMGLFPDNDDESKAEQPSPFTYRVKYWPKEIVSSTKKGNDSSLLLPIDAFPDFEKLSQNDLPFSAPHQIVFDKEVKHEFWTTCEHVCQDKFQKFLKTKKEVVSFDDAWQIIIDSIWEDEKDTGGAYSKLGGHPLFTQEDPRDDWAKEDRMLLCQLDSDGPVMIGDVGVMNFFNDEKRTAKGDFSKVKYTWDCG